MRGGRRRRKRGWRTDDEREIKLRERG
jgi:hypothetical protein